MTFETEFEKHKRLLRESEKFEVENRKENPQDYFPCGCHIDEFNLPVEPGQMGLGGNLCDVHSPLFEEFLNNFKEMLLGPQR